MDVREKLVELLTDNLPRIGNLPKCDNPLQYTMDELVERIADHLIDNGVTITPAVPGPSEDDPNIMELCFRNGERHMKEKVGKELTKLAEHIPCITLAQALAMLEGL